MRVSKIGRSRKSITHPQHLENLIQIAKASLSSSRGLVISSTGTYCLPPCTVYRTYQSGCRTSARKLRVPARKHRET